MTQYEVTLVHYGGTRERVPVLGTEGYKLRVLWGMAGIYKLDLRSGVLIGTRNFWSAADLEEAKKIYRILAAPVKKAVVRACTVCKGAGTYLGKKCMICKAPAVRLKAQ